MKMITNRQFFNEMAEVRLAKTPDAKCDAALKVIMRRVVV
jgi:hypothetical protein